MAAFYVCPNRARVHMYFPSMNAGLIDTHAHLDRFLKNGEIEFSKEITINFAVSGRAAEKPFGEAARQTDIHKGVTVRFGFDDRRTSQTLRIVKNKATGTPRGVYYMHSSSIHGIHCRGFEGLIYLHRRGAFSVARSDNPGNAKAFLSWNG